MAFQKCPVCDGTGKSITEFGGACNVCKGYCIINSHTGLPPKKIVTTINTSAVEDDLQFLENVYLTRRYGDLKEYIFKDENLKMLDFNNAGGNKLKCPEEGGKCAPPTQTEE